MPGQRRIGVRYRTTSPGGRPTGRRETDGVHGPSPETLAAVERHLKSEGKKRLGCVTPTREALQRRGDDQGGQDESDTTRE